MSDIMNNFNKARQALYDHVGFVEDWVLCPIDDCTDSYWLNYNDEKVLYHKERKNVIEANGDHYEDDVYTQRFYTKWVYRGKELTMIFCDPHVDGVQWLRVFDNKKEVELRKNK
jgi:hypothetical protein